ncbi:hypothetical protein ACOTFR_12125 [Achromobacter xylosoxidans]
MSRNVKKFIQHDLFDWLVSNSVDPGQLSQLDRNKFWIQPVAKETADISDKERELVEKFQSAKVVGTVDIDSWCLQIVDVADSRQVMIANRRGSFDDFGLGSFFSFASEDSNFLQRMQFIAGRNLVAARPIPNRIMIDAVQRKEPILEADLEIYLPKVATRITDAEEPSRSRHVGALFSKVLIELESDNYLIKTHGLEFAALALSLPEQDHDWLFDQLYYAICCRRPEHLYLALYRMLEFFFPIKGLSSLKSQLQYQGSVLQLREHCRSSLNWNVNHQYGARAAADYGGVNFAALCLGREISIDADADAVNKFKGDAIEKITDLRHRLAHQTFNGQVVTPADLESKTRAIIILLKDAFAQYSGVVDNFFRV